MGCLPAPVWSSSESLYFCWIYNPIWRLISRIVYIYLYTQYKYVCFFLWIYIYIYMYIPIDIAGPTPFGDFKITKPVMILMLPTGLICEPLRSDKQTCGTGWVWEATRAEDEHLNVCLLLSLFFFFKQETTCLKTSTWPQQVSHNKHASFWNSLRFD